MREKVKAISEEDFLVQRQAVHTVLAEKDITLQRESSRMWTEIFSQQLQFDRQQSELDQLKLVTKQDFIDLFEEVFFSDKSKRLDLELTSKTHEAENEEVVKTNGESGVFKEVFTTRTICKGSMDEFK
jgi:secreted Zn-dependent insulinase-like peptidase